MARTALYSSGPPSIVAGIRPRLAIAAFRAATSYPSGPGSTPASCRRAWTWSSGWRSLSHAATVIGLSPPRSTAGTREGGPAVRGPMSVILVDRLRLLALLALLAAALLAALAGLDLDLLRLLAAGARADRNAALARVLRLRQRQRQHAVVVVGLGLAGVDVGRQADDPLEGAEAALAHQPATLLPLLALHLHLALLALHLPLLALALHLPLALLPLGLGLSLRLPLGLGLLPLLPLPLLPLGEALALVVLAVDADRVADHRDINVLRVHTWHRGVDDVVVALLAHVDRDGAHLRAGAALRPDEALLEEIVHRVPQTDHVGP